MRTCQNYNCKNYLKTWDNKHHSNCPYCKTEGEKVETIKINDKEYVLKENNNTNFGEVMISLLDEVNVMGVGSVKLQGDWKIVKVSTEYLEKAIKILNQITYDNKKRKEVVIAITNDYPLCIGDIKKDVFSGVIIAPRQDE